MTKTIPADYIGKENVAYALVAVLSPQSQQRIGSLLAELATELPGIIWTMPLEALHITLLEIIQAKGYSQDKQELYLRHQQEYQQFPEQILAAFPKMQITFDMIEASQNAIILRGDNQDTFNAIRARLVGALPLPIGTSPPPNIVHTSIARYVSEVDLEHVQAIVGRHGISLRDLREEIVAFKLIKNIVSPLMTYEVIQTYSLA